ncbi:hypothetical protein EN845_35025, partial [Mesorhizobium sp. M8A.F.Ca.ET.202.01.1.1]|uniref:hypothetical protein n=1 Tax=Mesorhizobium sp. M8A.F.Ca.ET.202.01.1.1 TaxID=2563967 RepID=UPI00109388D6
MMKNQKRLHLADQINYCFRILQKQKCNSQNRCSKVKDHRQRRDGRAPAFPLQNSHLFSFTRMRAVSGPVLIEFERADRRRVR